MSNALVRQVGLRVGPLFVGTLIKHYLERVKKDAENRLGTQLRKDDVVYDEIFSIVRAFMEAASLHTVEEVQEFSNTRTPAPPWVKLIRLLVPMSCCDEAASYLIKALGGEEVARRVVGGMKWWQVRGNSGVEAEWITAKKDWQEQKRRYKARQNNTQKSESTMSSVLSESQLGMDAAVYDEDMDEMRCILYAHGGGYYFGSTDQERYSIQRYARKINGRVFAVNYRLAPQYPFPCAVQDLVAAYIYLVRPPPEAKHRPIKPAHIVVAGDSAGGGLSLALLQVIRDSGLPAPAGAVLISPWCDLTHSFPSIHKNTPTDVIPAHGLSFQKPSPLWPPPSDEMSRRVHEGLRTRIRRALHTQHHTNASSVSLGIAPSDKPTGPVNVGSTARLSSGSNKVSITTASGEIFETEQQLHLYAPNSNLVHPLVSPALSYLGGLPPLLVIASDKEVLRDEIIYTAHKAAYPDRFPINAEAAALYPHLEVIQNKGYKPTSVHLQVYDDCAHVLPVLFPFTTPAKFCFRAMAAFCKEVTGMKQTPATLDSMNSIPRSSSNIPRREKSFNSLFSRSRVGTSSEGEPPPVPKGVPTPETDRTHSKRRSLSLVVGSRIRKVSATTSVASDSTILLMKAPFPSHTGDIRATETTVDEIPQPPKMPTVHITESPDATPFTEDPSPIERIDADTTPPTLPPANSEGEKQTGRSSSFNASTNSSKRVLSSSRPKGPNEERLAGDPAIYTRGWKDTMIRERVSTQGVLRPLEPEEELDALKVPADQIGVMSELIMRRYIDAKNKFDTKFASQIKTIEKHRLKQLELSKRDITRNIAVLQNSVASGHMGKKGPKHEERGIAEGLLPSSGSWTWAWVLDADEIPPASSIVSRRDTTEARKLAMVADQHMSQEENLLSGNNLWQLLVNSLSGSKSSTDNDEGQLSEPQSPRRSRFLHPRKSRTTPA